MPKGIRNQQSKSSLANLAKDGKLDHSDLDDPLQPPNLDNELMFGGEENLKQRKSINKNMSLTSK